MTPLQKRRPVLLNHAFSALTLLVFAPGHSLSAAGLPEHHRILSCILELWPHRPRAPSLSGKHNVSPGIDKYLLGTKRPLFQNHFTSHRHLLPGLLHHPSTWPSWCPTHTHTHPAIITVTAIPGGSGIFAWFSYLTWPPRLTSTHPLSPSSLLAFSLQLMWRPLHLVDSQSLLLHAHL